MEKLTFRVLTADEIECRVAQAGKSGNRAYCSLLLYKDARCDQRLLDETVGCFAWKREHQLINGNLYCTVSIKSPDGEWVSKQDVGTESNTEAVKGEASDNLGDGEYTDNGKVKVSQRLTFKVSSIEYDNKRNIKSLVIVDGNGEVRYSMGGKTQVKESKPKTTKQPTTLFEGEDVALAELFDSTKAYIQAAKTTAELFKINDEYPALKGYKPFIDMLNKRYKEVV